MSRPLKVKPLVLWCPKKKNAPNRSGKNGWRFPDAVELEIKNICKNLSVLHMFGGLAQFGVRLDIDLTVRPDVVGDVWLPPFKKDSFDCVVLDPPYKGEFKNFSGDLLRILLRNAAFIARKKVIWFHTLWLGTPARCKLEKAYLVRVGDHCQVRCLQVFKAPSSLIKIPPTTYFTRGPAVKYNRWIMQPRGLPFEKSEGDNNGRRANVGDEGMYGRRIEASKGRTTPAGTGTGKATSADLDDKEKTGPGRTAEQAGEN